MIVDQMCNFNLFLDLIPGIEDAYHFILNSDSKEAGKYQCGKGYAIIQEGVTQHIEEGLMEVHRRYVDVTALISGHEFLEWYPRQLLHMAKEYNQDRDAEFLSGRGNYIEIEPGMFYISFPDDAHKSCCHIVDEKQYRKIVVKVPIETYEE